MAGNHPKITTEQHLKKANHNAMMVNKLEPHDNGFGDWTIIALFYAALHYVDSQLVKFGMRPENHTERSNCLHRVPRFRTTVYKPYRSLFRLGLMARYAATEMSRGEVKKAFENLDSIRKSFGLPPK